MTVPHLELEELLWQKGFVHVAGVDEAGRGPLAGPVTAGAVLIHTPSQVVPLVRDSKYMTPGQREEAFALICKHSSGFGIGIVSAEEIDSLGITTAVKLAMQQALSNLEKNFSLKLSYVIVDGCRTAILDHYISERMKAGGLYHYSISAGSVLAKVTRDRIMKEYAVKYPEYGFEKHFGYGTKAHYQKIVEYGPSAIHRHSFRLYEKKEEKMR